MKGDGLRPPLRVAFQLPGIGERPGGVGVHVTELLRGLVGLRPEYRYMALVVSLRHAATFRGELRKIDPQGRLEPRVVRVPGSIVERVGARFHTPPMSLLLRGRYDVFHLMWLRSDPPVPSSKLVVTMHDTVSLEWPAHEASLPREASRVLRRAAAVITVSEHARNSILEAFAPDPDRVHVIPNGCDTGTFRPDHDPADVAATLSRLGVPAPYLLSVGGQTPRKNLRRMVRAFGMVKSRFHVPHTLVHVGPSLEPSPELIGAVTEAGVSDSFLSLGFVSDTAMSHLYSGADALLFPSLAEGFGLPVVEALASGTAVLTSAISSLPEVAGGAAMLVDPHDTEAIAEGLVTLLQQPPAVREERRRRGLVHARTFSWERAARQHLDVYDAVAARTS